eukprot:TRINITY_DN76_c3_g1_i1.p1 TRINITY_DN76_c3_g1~~TRINITY_DN76_c3_g1_i1.p1  ORF type:complete len:420 (-),score=92.07 TRINITY_DN76_c3_g1_i1:222-1298(-)
MMNCLTSNEMNALFSNLDVIRGVNQQMLDMMEARVKDFSSTEYERLVIGDIFSKQSDLFKMYTQYVANQPQLISTLESCQRSNSEFFAYIKTAESDTRSKGLSILSWLIKPIQRICKYPLLLRDLLKNTPNYHLDHGPLTVALRKIEQVVNYVNEKKREAEEQFRVVEIQKSIDGIDNLVSPTRRIMREGRMLASFGSEREATYQLWLFNDLIAAAKPKRRLLGATRGPAKNDSSSKAKYDLKVAWALNEVKIVVASSGITIFTTKPLTDSPQMSRKGLGASGGWSASGGGGASSSSRGAKEKYTKLVMRGQSPEETTAWSLDIKARVRAFQKQLFHAKHNNRTGIATAPSPSNMMLR